MVYNTIKNQQIQEFRLRKSNGSINGNNNSNEIDQRYIILLFQSAVR